MSANLLEYVPRVFGFALRLTGDRHAAEDLTQETFLRACRAGGGPRGTAGERVWLFQITANLWRDLLRRRKLAPERAEPYVSEQVCRRIGPGVRAEQNEQVAAALHELDQLPERQREVLYLAACEGLEHAEIAEVLGCTRDAVKTNLSLARRKMRAWLAASERTDRTMLTAGDDERVKVRG